MTQEELLSVAEIIERLVKRFEEQGAEHARKLAEHSAAFGARTEADRQIIEGLRADVEDLRNRLNSLGPGALAPLVGTSPLYLSEQSAWDGLDQIIAQGLRSLRKEA